MALTVKQVERIKTPGRHFDDDGLYLQVTKKGSKSWLLRYARNGHERWMGVGGERDYKLDEARERARKFRQLLNDGIDPIDQRRALKAEQVTAATEAKAPIQRLVIYLSRGWIAP